MSRKLATITPIAALTPIPGADAIEAATLRGWKVVVKVGEFAVGNLAVYFEIDSFLPIRPEFEFLRKSSYRKLADGQEGFRLRTIKLRGQVSQGLALPLHLFPELGMVEAGQDITEALGVILYEPPVPAELAGIAKGPFPGWIQKTDEERIQNLPDLLGSFSPPQAFICTEKLDGSSSTYYYRYGGFGVCSRNLELLEVETNTLWRMARTLDLEAKLTALQRNLALQGELVGEGIQGNPYKLRGQKVFFFNAYDIDLHQRLPYDEFKQLIKSLGLEQVPQLPFTITSDMSVDQILSLAEGPSALNPNIGREGIVCRTPDQHTSFKAISNQWLLGEG